MSVVFVQSAAVKVCLKRWHRRENTSEYSWHFNQSSSHSAAEDRKLLLFCYAFLRNTQEEKENCLFLSCSLSLQTTNHSRTLSHSLNGRFPRAKAPRATPLKCSQKREQVFDMLQWLTALWFSFGHPVFSPIPLLEVSRKIKLEEQRSLGREWGRVIVVLYTF